jgi:hypothetical protein
VPFPKAASEAPRLSRRLSEKGVARHKTGQLLSFSAGNHVFVITTPIIGSTNLSGLQQKVIKILLFFPIVFLLNKELRGDLPWYCPMRRELPDTLTVF